MIPPLIDARVEEPIEFSVGRENGAEVSTFIPIAEDTGESEVVGDGSAAVFLANDVFDLAAKKGIVGMNQAVLAHPARPLLHQPP